MIHFPLLAFSRDEISFQLFFPRYTDSLKFSFVHPTDPTTKIFFTFSVSTLYHFATTAATAARHCAMRFSTQFFYPFLSFSVPICFPIPGRRKKAAVT